MKIRVLSDLHIDINSDYPLELEDKDMFTIICGDTSGTPSESIEWIRNNVHNGVGVTGNHLVYNYCDKTVYELKEELHKAFPIDNSFTFLDEACGVVSKEVNGILFVGSCFYTDYKLPINNNSSLKQTAKEIKLKNMLLSHRCMNDFKWGFVDTTVKERKSFDEKTGTFLIKGFPDFIYMTPNDYLKWFKSTFKAIKKVLDENENSESPKPVILITHHCLSKKCIVGDYVNASTNASYCSDLEKFIKSYKYIKVVCSGHIHSGKTFDIKRKDGSIIHYVMNPRGYINRGECRNFNKRLYIDTDTWEVISPQKTKEEIEEENKINGGQIRNLAWF